MEDEDNFFGGNPDPRRENFERLEAERAYWKKRDREIAESKRRKLEENLLADANAGISQKKKGAHYLRYSKFYEEGKDVSLNLERESDHKRQLLIKYFSSRFGEEGNQPLINKTDLKIGAIFKRLIESAEKYKD